MSACHSEQNAHAIAVISKRRKWVFIVACLLVVVTLLPLAMGFSVCRDWAFIDENTGSRKGYRQWCFGARTGHWYMPSSVETFMRSQHASDLTHRWTSYAGTGRNVFGAKGLYGHGRPGAILQLDQKRLNQWFEQQTPADQRAFYDLLVKSDQAAIREKIDAIYAPPP